MRAVAGWPLLIAVGFCGLATWAVLIGDSQFPYAVNQNLTHPVFARVEFQRVNEIQTAELRKRDQEMVPDYYILNQALLDRIRAEIQNLHAAVNAVDDLEQYQSTAGNRWNLDESAFTELKALTDEDGAALFKGDLSRLIDDIASESMIERFETDRPVPSRVDYVELERGDDAPTPVRRDRLKYVTNSQHVTDLASGVGKDRFPAPIQPIVADIITKSIVPGEDGNHYQPVYLYDRDKTRGKIEAAGQRPPVKETFEAGDLLVASGSIDTDALELLRVEHAEFEKQREADPTLARTWQRRRIGLGAAVLIITIALAGFSLVEQPRILRNPNRALALAALLLGMLLIDQLTRAVFRTPICSVGAMIIVASIVTISYSQRFAIGVTALASVLAALALGESIGLIILLLTVSTINVALLADIRTRFQLVEAGALTALVGGLVALAMQFLALESVATSFWIAAVAVAASLAGTSIFFLMLSVIERTFGIATSLTLLEWADTSKPLLRQLIQKAPGTWQHSHLLGSMAESAAETIGANGLLVRVGAYYHDIGKTCKPEYFVENQQAHINAHAGLAPTMSLLVILAHVKDGLALAREHKLPPVLHQFIAEHHGTTVVRYFHAMAAQGARPTGKHDREVSEAEFRYPGPKPRTREAVILMLCDSVEGAVRALQEPTPGRIESKVHEIVMARLLDRQVDDCEITLKELARVEQSLVKSLCAIHHGRIAYPTQQTEKPMVQVAQTA